MKVDTHRLSKGLFFQDSAPPCWVALYHCFAPALTTFQSAAAPLVSLRAFLSHNLVPNASFDKRIFVRLRNSTSLQIDSKLSVRNFTRGEISVNKFAETIAKNQSEKIPPRSAPLTVKTFQLYKNWNWQTFSCVETLSRRLYRHESTYGDHVSWRNDCAGLSKREQSTMARLRRRFSV